MQENFLPVDLEELADALTERKSPQLGTDFARFLRLFTALQRAKLQDLLADLRLCYRALDPDTDTVSREEASPEQAVSLRERLHVHLVELLRQANYVELPQEGLDQALTKVSPRGLAVSVDLEDFEELGIHYRGLYTRQEEARDWRYLYLKKRQWETPVYRRLFLFLKLPPGAEEGQEDARFLYLKLFRDVPQSDLEMLLPNTRVRMRAFDKLKIGVTGGGGTAGGVLATVTKIGAAANPTTWALAIAGLAGVLWRQVSKIFVTRTRYLADLAQQLYFCNLDNNYGALVHLADVAQLEESKEAILAYAFLATKEHGLRREQLDLEVEAYLAEHFGVQVDYEVEDGLAKLARAGLLQRKGEQLCVPNPTAAFAQLDREWDDLFRPATT